MSHSDPFATADAALRAKTGRSLSDWIAIARGCPETGHMKTVGWLKRAHGLGHGHANTIVHALNDSAAILHDKDELLAAMFAGPKAAMLEVHTAVIAALDELGSDIELSPKKGYVSFRRSKQFALGQPSTRDRYDLGLVLKGEAPNRRLEAAGSWNGMVTHRVRISAPGEVDAAVKAWLRDAYERA